MAFAKRDEGKKVNSNINVIPMVDVMLVLLIIFMVITPMLQKGRSVDLAKTNNPIQMPDADKEDALLVAVTRDNRIFFGNDVVNDPGTLTDKVRDRLQNKTDKRVFIKADARAPFRAVEQALRAAHEVFFESAVLLTEQTQPGAEGPIVPPQGLEVRLGLASSPATVVEMHNSGRPIPAVKVNDREIPWQALQNALEQAFQNQNEKLVVVEADGSLPFAQILRVIDLSRSVTAQIAVSLTGL